ncbi:MAG: AAA family ATPase [Planctomycetota bacterium]
MDTPSEPLLKSVTLEGFLSFGNQPAEIQLSSLNVIIGPNGSGKSNFIEALSVMRAVPRDLPLPIRRGGGVKEWLWNGDGEVDNARIELVLSEGHIAHEAVRYRLVFGSAGGSFQVVDERIENARSTGANQKPYFYFGYENGRPTLNVSKDADQYPGRELRREDVDPTQSILSQRKDPERYPELAKLSDALGQIRIYRSWQFGPDAPFRMACRAD